MGLNKKIFVGLALAILPVLSVASAQAVSGPSLPDGQHIFAVEQTPSQVWSVSPDDATSTPIGSHSDTIPGYIQYFAVNPVDGLMYAIESTNDARYVDSVDTETGVITRIHTVDGATNDEVLSAMVFDGKGNAYLVSRDNRFYDLFLNSLNLVTGDTARIGDLGAVFDGLLAYRAEDDTVYHYANDGTAYTVNMATAVQTPTPEHNLSLAEQYLCADANHGLGVIAGAFDADSNLWFTNNACNAELLVADFATGTVSFRGVLTDGGHTVKTNAPYQYFTDGVVITGQKILPSEPTLAKTGSNPTAAVIAGLFGLVVVGAGARLLISSRKLKRS